MIGYIGPGFGPPPGPPLDVLVLLALVVLGVVLTVRFVLRRVRSDLSIALASLLVVHSLPVVAALLTLSRITPESIVVLAASAATLIGAAALGVVALASTACALGALPRLVRALLAPDVSPRLVARGGPL